MMRVSFRRAASSFCLLVFSVTAVGVAPAQTGNLVVADFEGKTPETSSGLTVMVIADEQFGGTSQARPVLIQPGANASRGALRISFRLGGDFPAPFAGVWVLLAPEGQPMDLSAYRGVRLYARSKDARTVTAGMVRYAGQVRRYMKSFETRSEWTIVELPFDQFREMMPPGAPAAGASALVPTDVTAIGITSAPQQSGELDVDIDHVEFYR